MDIFSRHGFPDVIVLDNATIFTSEQFQNFCKESGVFLKFIAPGHPATNGLAERNVQTVKNRISAMISDTRSMREKIRKILFRYRSTPLSNGKSPAEMYLQRTMRIQLDALKPTKFQKSLTPIKAARQISVGERVQARYYHNNKNMWKPGTIVKKFGQLYYEVRFDDGYTLKRHIDQLRRTRVQSCQSEVEDDANANEEPVEPTTEINLGDLVIVPEQRKEVIPSLTYIDEQKEVEEEILQDQINHQSPPLRRSNRQHKMPTFLRRNYIL